MRRSLIRALVLSGLVVSPVGIELQAQDDAARIKQAGRGCLQGERALKVGALERSQQQFARALRTYPGFPNAHLGLGHVAMARGEFTIALEQYRSARANFGDLGHAVRDLQAQRYRSARSDMTALRDEIVRLLKFSGATNTRQQIFQLQNQIAQLEVIEPPQADGAGEPPGEYEFYIGNALFQLDRLDEAIAAWERCREQSPAFAMVYNNLALAYWKSGRLDDAIAALDRAGALGFPVNPEFRRDLEQAAAPG